jgi:hypothetical protein
MGTGRPGRGQRPAVGAVSPPPDTASPALRKRTSADHNPRPDSNTALPRAQPSGCAVVLTRIQVSETTKLGLAVTFRLGAANAASALRPKPSASSFVVADQRTDG